MDFNITIPLDETCEHNFKVYINGEIDAEYSFFGEVINYIYYLTHEDTYVVRDMKIRDTTIEYYLY